VGGCLYEKRLDAVFPFAKISLKHHWNAIEQGYFCYNISYFARKWKQMVLAAEKNRE
jgi:hypothetical protein